MHRFSWFLVLWILSLTSAVQAAEKHWTHYGLRPLGMGNAFVAVADDYNALFYNPAGLARLKEWDGEFLNPSFALSKNTRAFVDDMRGLQSGDSTSQTKDVLKFIEGQAGKSQYFSVGLTPHLVFKNFGFGIGAELIEASASLHRYPSVELEIGPRLIIPISFALNMLEDRLSMGFTVKGRVRGGVNHEFSIQDLEALKNDDKDNKNGPKLEDYVEGGIGYGADFGILFTPVKTMEPTLGLSVTDIGGTAYKKLDVGGQAVSAPEMELPSVNIGASLKPLQAGGMYLLTAVDFHSINQPISFSKKLNIGSELGYGKIIKLQAGLHHGYMSAGMQFDVGLFNLRAITYAEELGTVAGTVEDRRYALQLKLLL